MNDDQENFERLVVLLFGLMVIWLLIVVLPYVWAAIAAALD